jgi:hypothetical protein
MLLLFLQHAGRFLQVEAARISTYYILEIFTVFIMIFSLFFSSEVRRIPIASA